MSEDKNGIDGQLVATREDIRRYTEKLASTIRNHYAFLNSNITNPDRLSLLVVTVGEGGLAFSNELAPNLRGIPTSFQTIHFQRYGLDCEGDANPFKLNGDISLPYKGQHVLIVDDVNDSGSTLDRLSQAYYALGAKTVRTAVLVEFSHSNNPATFVALPPQLLEAHQSRFLFGCGMDRGSMFSCSARAGEDFRNIPNLYSAEPDADTGNTSPEPPGNPMVISDYIDADNLWLFRIPSGVSSIVHIKDGVECHKSLRQLKTGDSIRYMHEGKNYYATAYVLEDGAVRVYHNSCGISDPS